MRPRTVRAFGFVILFLACVVSAAAQPATVSEAAQWAPSDATLQAARLGCGDIVLKAGRCLIEALERGGAPPAAVAFAKWIEGFTNGDVGFLRSFRETGRVDVAYLTHPLRAGDPEAVWLVNGRPAALDVDDFNNLPRQHLVHDSIYTAIVNRHGAVTLWPGDRRDPSEPVAASIVAGGQRFTASYLLRKGCRACDVVGVAKFAFDFDAGGAFTRATLVSVSDRISPGGPTPIGPAAVAPATTLHIQVGETFTLPLPRDPGADAGWRLARDLDGAILTSLDKELKVTPGTRLGSDGREVWTFKAVGAGTARIQLEYVKAGRVERTMTYTVVVR